MKGKDIYLCWLCYLDGVWTWLEATDQHCPNHGLVKDQILGFVQVDVRILDPRKERAK